MFKLLKKMRWRKLTFRLNHAFTAFNLHLPVMVRYGFNHASPIGLVLLLNMLLIAIAKQ